MGTTFSSNYTYMVPVAVYVSAGSEGSPQSVDFQLTIPTDWDLFWTTIRSDGRDVVITDNDGKTKPAFSRSSFVYASRTLVLDVDNWVAPSGGGAVNLCWLHFGYASEATDHTVATAVASPITGYVEQSKPSGRVLVYDNQRPGVSAARLALSKQSTETIHLWIGFPGLAARRSRFNGSWAYEWLKYVVPAVLDAGVAQAGMVTLADTRFHDVSWVRMTAKAGSSGTNYTVSLKVVTNQSQTLNARYQLRVKDVT